jgi:RNA polymerase sigma-70 factor (ECF subfamily)
MLKRIGFGEIAALVEKNETACRKLLEHARGNIAKEKRLFAASPEVHLRLLTAFHQAASAGDLDALVSTLAEDASLITDGGASGKRAGGIRNLKGAPGWRPEDRRIRFGDRPWRRSRKARHSQLCC